MPTLIHRPRIAVLAFVLLSGAAAAADNTNRIAPASNSSTWKVEIRTQHDAIRALPATPKEPVTAAIRKLAAQGPDARPALTALAADASLPEPHRAMSGIMSAYFIRFHANALRAMAESSTNPFARRQAIDFLAEIGGPQNKAFLGSVAKKDATLTAYVNKALARAPANETLGADDGKILSVILLEPVEAKTTAIAHLVDRHKGKPGMDAWLEALLNSPVSDNDAQMHASTALVKIHAGSVPELKALTARNKHRFVRYNAVVELSRSGPAGELVLQELLAAPNEPLRKHIETRLAKK